MNELPDHLTSSLLSWLQDVTHATSSLGSSQPVPDTIRWIERAMHEPLDWGRSRTSTSTAWTNLRDIVAEYPEVRLSVLQAALSLFSTSSEIWPDAVEMLDQLLDHGGADWRVLRSGDQFTLVERVNPAVKATNEIVLETRSSASHYLAEANRKAYGPEPNASDAYKDAIRAVESAASEVIRPGKGQTKISDIARALGKPGWAHALHPTEGMTATVSMLNALQRGQTARHGGPDTSPMDVDLAASRAAVHLAATLVQWFLAGCIARRP